MPEKRIGSTTWSMAFWQSVFSKRTDETPRPEEKDYVLRVLKVDNDRGEVEVELWDK